ncbi:hypothetical protein [Actinophytocola sp.]|uniref:hypothetical protein n=1 Tax=Actinophytocola sp. TaxID=1872138 RepID=UPI002ED22181
MFKHHGTPITPLEELYALRGECFCVSYSDPRNVEICHQIGQAVMLDNGAYSAWTLGRTVDWDAFVAWARPWLDYSTTWAVMPDVIAGSQGDNKELQTWLAETYPDVWRRSAPVWHMHEDITYLAQLCHQHERVCIGSSGPYADPTSKAWHDRMDLAMTSVCRNGLPPAKLHMLRAMAQVSGGPWPIYSADSTNVARNHHRSGDARRLAKRLDAVQPAGPWRPTGWQLDLFG